jgi:hypothetical protein
MGLTPRNPNDKMADFDGCGGTVGGAQGTPFSGPLQFPADQDPYTWEVHYDGLGGTAEEHGIFGHLLDSAYYLWNRLGRIVSLFDGTFSYSGAQFGLGLSKVINAMTGSGVPIVCTVSTTADLLAGMVVTISGAAGNTNANGTWRVAILNGTQFQLVNLSGGASPTGNGAYTANTAAVKYPMTLYYLAKFLADNAALISKGQTFTGNQGITGNLAVSGGLTVGGTFAPLIVQPTEYYGAPIADQSPAYTGSSNQSWTIGDPGTTVTPTTPAPTGQCNQIISPILRFSQWGNAGAATELDVHLLAHTGSDSPQQTIIFDPANQTIGSAGAQMEVWDDSSGTPAGIFCAANSSISATGIAASGSVTVSWKNGVGWRVVSLAGFTGATLTVCKW